MEETIWKLSTKHNPTDNHVTHCIVFKDGKIWHGMPCTSGEMLLMHSGEDLLDKDMEYLWCSFEDFMAYVRDMETAIHYATRLANSYLLARRLDGQIMETPDADETVQSIKNELPCEQVCENMRVLTNFCKK